MKEYSPSTHTILHTGPLFVGGAECAKSRVYRILNQFNNGYPLEHYDHELINRVVIRQYWIEDDYLATFLELVNDELAEVNETLTLASHASLFVLGVHEYSIFEQDTQDLEKSKLDLEAQDLEDQVTISHPAQDFYNSLEGQRELQENAQEPYEGFPPDEDDEPQEEAPEAHNDQNQLKNLLNQIETIDARDYI